MGRWKGKELSPLLSKSGVLSPLLSVSEPRAPPYTAEMIFTSRISQRPMGDSRSPSQAPLFLSSKLFAFSAEAAHHQSSLFPILLCSHPLPLLPTVLPLGYRRCKSAPPTTTCLSHTGIDFVTWDILAQPWKASCRI